MNWEELIAERDEWVDKNFPENKLDKPVDESLVGVVEELGELAHAHLKAAQGIRGTNEEHEKNARDAVGDCTIYLLGVLSHLRYTPNARVQNVELVRTVSPTYTLLELAGWVGQLCLNPNIRACDRIVELLLVYCDFQGWHYDEVVQETWDRVKQRDWTKNKEDGSTSNTPSSGVDAMMTRNVMQCEEHPGVIWPHGDCPGPGMPLVDTPECAPWLDDMLAGGNS